jgi:predicted nucleotide-binding protein
MRDRRISLAVVETESAQQLQLETALHDLDDLRSALNDPAREAIGLGWRRFHELGTWPSFPDFERALVRALPPGTDIWKALRATPTWVGWLGQAGHSSPITVKLLAVAACVGPSAAPVLQNFWTVMTLCRSIFINAPDDEQPQLHSRLLLEPAPQGLGMTRLEVDQVLELLRSESLLSLISTTKTETAYEWRAEIATHIYDYRDVKSIIDYLELRKRQEIPQDTTVDLASTSSRPLLMNSPELPQPDPRKVFVISGRDEEATKAVCDFLRDLDLHPLLWEELVAATGSASPYTGDVVARAFNEGRAVVAILTPDDEARLHPTLHGEHEEDYEREFTGQPRPNVLFEAGMALIAQPDRTVLIEIGRLRPVSDLTGRNTVRLGASPAPLLAFKQRLSAAGCAVRDTNPSWMDTNRFAKLAARTRQPLAPPAQSANLPRGVRLVSPPKPAEPNLTARLLERGEHSYLLEVSNRGGVVLRNVTWELPPGVANWDFANSVLPSYPYDELPPREYVRVPALVTFGGPVVVDLALSGDAPDGSRFETSARLSVFG